MMMMMMMMMTMMTMIKVVMTTTVVMMVTMMMMLTPQRTQNLTILLSVTNGRPDRHNGFLGCDGRIQKYEREGFKKFNMFL